MKQQQQQKAKEKGRIIKYKQQQQLDIFEILFSGTLTLTFFGKD